MSKVTIIGSLVSSIWISVGCWLIFPATLLAKSEPTTLYLQPIPYYMETIEQGTYVDLMQRFGKENNHDFVYLMASSERIEKLLVRGEEDYCSLGFSVELATTEGLPTGHLIESQSFNRIYTSILSRRETPVENVKGLNNKTLVVYHGNYQDAAQRIPVGFDTSIVTVYDINSLITTILKGRVDAGFVTSPDILMSPLYQQTESQMHLVELANSDRRESLVCIDSVENRKLIGFFNQFIDTMRKSGELNRYTDYQPD